MLAWGSGKTTETARSCSGLAVVFRETDMGLARELWAENHHLAQACLEHPFVQGIASGDLPLERFRFYVGQDAYFLDSFVRAYALLLAKAPDREGLVKFKELLDGAVEELRLHQGYARRWGVDLQPDPAPATAAYTDFLLRTAALEPVGHGVAAQTPCMRLYAYLGAQLLPVLRRESPYAEWVHTYAGADFQGLAQTLEGLLDRYGGDRGRLGQLYRRAMELEYAFFDTAWRSS
jgi:thiaminase/transcriptional activator TenA